MSAFGSFGSNQSTGAFGSFGNTAQQQSQQQPQQQQGGLFGGAFAGGNTSNQQNPLGGTALGASNPNTNTSGGGLFGNTAQTQQQTGGGLFGGATTQTSAGGGLFGSTQQTQPSTGGGLFGNAGQSNTTGGGLFGSTAPGQNTGGGGLFGNTNTGAGSTGTSGGIFGSTTNASQGTGGGLFGNTNTSNNTGGGLFGNTANTSTNTSGGLFGGANSNTNGTGGLFGSSSNTGTTGTSGGLFGSTTKGSTTSSGGLFTQTQTSQPSLFGQTQQTKPTGSIFGQSTQQQPAQGSLFGQPQQQQQQGSLFGQQQQQPQGSLFGNLSQPPAAGNSLFGGTNLFASRAPAPTQQPDPRLQFIALVQRIDSLKQAWDPNSPQCRFQHFFYNLVDPAQVHMYGRPANATNDAAWQKAVRENPDPSCLVPVLAVGLDDLQQRVDAQSKQAAEHQEKLKELKTRIEALSQRHQLTNVSRLGGAAALQTQLTHRVLKVIQHLHLLIPALRSSSIRPEEEALRAALEDIDEEIRRPGGMGKMRGKLNELWALVDAVRAARERDRQDGAVEWAVVDEDGLSQIAQILAEEQAGLAHVTKILQKDLKDLSVIQGIPVKQEEPDVLLGSVSALRGSVLR